MPDKLRAIDGIVLVNKPAGLTSNAVLQRVKRLYQAKKAGHTGSLDPMATGMLPICLGEATKFCQYLLDADKCYEATGLLGVQTNTGDATGEVVLRVEHEPPTSTQWQVVLPQFTGVIEQIPSMFSALKHQGKPLYVLARKGIEIERKPRQIVIYDLKLEGVRGMQFDLRVTCSKGTYIRNLVEDLGVALGSCAHVTRLHRCYTAGLGQEVMYTLDELGEMSQQQRLACLLPADRAVASFPKMPLAAEDVHALFQGKVLHQEGQAGCYRLYHESGQFVGLGDQHLDSRLTARRLIQNISVDCMG